MAVSRWYTTRIGAWPGCATRGRGHGDGGFWFRISLDSVIAIRIWGLNGLWAIGYR